MSLLNLIVNGRQDGGRLEKFADGCNSMARSFWLGHRVVLLKEGNGYTLQDSGSGRTITSRWMDVAESSCGIYAAGVIIAPVIMIAYALLCIPITITMGIGLIAKKIVLATDEQSNRYQIIANKYLLLGQKEKKLKKLTPLLRSEREILNFFTTEIENLENIQILGNAENPCKHTFEKNRKRKIETLKERIKSTTNEIEILNKKIDSRAEQIGQLKTEVLQLLKTYVLNSGHQAERAQVALAPVVC
jgi:hypothetical protein